MRKEAKKLRHKEFTQVDQLTNLATFSTQKITKLSTDEMLLLWANKRAKIDAYLKEVEHGDI
jgi:hypothetical protein